jgi:hypothetical protein
VPNMDQPILSDPYHCLCHLISVQTQWSP